MSFSSKLFQETSILQEHLDGFESRPQQIAMAEAVERAIERSNHLIVEAGTGVGKSLAYLVPFIHWAVSENKRVCISTYTKALQNQIYVKDLPFLKRALKVDFNYALCLGSENYVCLRKASSASKIKKTKKNENELKKITEWLNETRTGIVQDMDFVPDRFIWDKFSRDTDICMNWKCPYKDDCFYLKARKLQNEAHVLISNHALLFTDIAGEASILPDYQALVLDEAHTLEDVATNYFGREIGTSSIRYLMDAIIKILEGNINDLVKIQFMREVTHIKESINMVESCSEKFFRERYQDQKSPTEEIEINVEAVGPEDISDGLVELSGALMGLARSVKKKEGKKKASIGFEELARIYAAKCADFANTFDFIFGTKDPRYIYWSEKKEWKKTINFSFHAAPLNIGENMSETIFERIAPVILTSATLSSGGDFEFIKKRLGLADCDELLLDSPFDYSNNVLLYVPKGISDPASQQLAYRKEVKNQILDIYNIMGGRIFALFTSYDMLNNVAGKIREEYPNINILKQGDMPRYVLLDVFKKNKDSILMGTMTFWQGVDVPGKALECVIITKLPFTVPTDPVNSARINLLKKEGHNPFYQYQLPQAVIMFKQGFGRLIRAHVDRGIVAVLDPRVRSRSYGKEFIGAIPKCTETSDISNIAAFFQK